MPDILSKFNTQGSIFSDLDGGPGFTNQPNATLPEQAGTEFINVDGEVLSPADENPSPLSNVSGNEGNPVLNDILTFSALHNTYSLNGDPEIPGKPIPSTLDLNGRTPIRYQDNAPPGAQGGLTSTVTS